MPGRIARDPAERFRELYVVDSSGCWLWTGHVTPNGYGQFWIGSRTDGTRRPVGAHRWAVEHFVGTISDDLTVDHLCRVRRCVNPDHLEPVTHSVNVRRALAAAV